MIETKNLTLRYGNGKGIFDVSFAVGTGEAVGYLGPNGAGKTTTIRQLMGFMRPDGGSCTIGGLDCFAQAPVIQRDLGYIPGEIVFLEDLTGEEYLSYVEKVRGLAKGSRRAQLLDRFEFSPKGAIKKYSKGMKQKLGIVAAFLHDPQVLILDEPTSGLDPLMQNRFVELLQEEKARGKTILLSSHIFEEVERTCDTVLIIKEGRLVAQSDIPTLKSAQRRKFLVGSPQLEPLAQALGQQGFALEQGSGGLEAMVSGEKIDSFIKALAAFPITRLESSSQSLEDVFMHFYAKEGEAK